MFQHQIAWGAKEQVEMVRLWRHAGQRIVCWGTGGFLGALIGTVKAISFSGSFFVTIQVEFPEQGRFGMRGWPMAAWTHAWWRLKPCLRQVER
jgi:hypothetical protein